MRGRNKFYANKMKDYPYVIPVSSYFLEYRIILLELSKGTSLVHLHLIA